MKNNYLLRFIAVLLLFASLSLFFYEKSYAFFGFGGTIIIVQACNNGFLVTIGPPKGGLFLLPPGAVIYPFGKIAPGSWTLGAFSPGGVCILGQILIPVQGTILMIGTS